METKSSSVNIGDIIPVFSSSKFETMIDVPSSHPFLTISVRDFIKNNNINSNSDMINYLNSRGLNTKLNSTLKSIDFITIFKSKIASNVVIIEHNNGISFYIPTTRDNQTANSIEIDIDGNLKVIENNHTPLVIDGVRFGSVNVIDIKFINNAAEYSKYTQCVIPHDRLTTQKYIPCFDVSIEKATAVINNGVIISRNNQMEQIVCVANSRGSLEPVTNNSYNQIQYKTIVELGFDENFFKKPKIAGINYDHEGNEIIYDNEDLSHLLAFSPKEIKEATIKSEDYTKFLIEINNILDSQSNDDYLAIEFNVIGDSDKTCDHKLSRITNDNKRDVIHTQAFPYDDTFKSELLQPTIVDFAKRSTVLSSFVAPNKNSGNKAIMTSNYRAITENNNVLSINNIDNEYANNIANAIIKVVAVEEEEITTVPNGYATTVILSLILSLICGLVLGVTYMLYTINNM